MIDLLGKKISGRKRCLLRLIDSLELILWGGWNVAGPEVSYFYLDLWGGWNVAGPECNHGLSWAIISAPYYVPTSVPNLVPL